jgi:hypothetical protein
LIAVATFTAVAPGYGFGVRARRASIGVRYEMFITRMDAVFPIAIASAMDVIPAMMGIDRIVAAATAMVIRPIVNAAASAPRFVIVAVVVVTIVRSREQADVERADVEADAGRPSVADAGVNRRAVIDGGIANAAAGDEPVPIAATEDIAARRPRIIMWHPAPIGTRLPPISWPPRIAHVLPDPRAGNPEVPFGWRFARRSDFKRFWRSGLVFDLFLIGGRPEAGRPLPTAGRFTPVSRNPATARRNVAPHAADPDEVLALIFPCPIAGNPFDLFALGLLCGRKLVDRVGWFLRNDQTGLRIERCWIGESFVNWAAREHLGGHVFIRGDGNNRDGSSGGVVKGWRDRGCSNRWWRGHLFAGLRSFWRGEFHFRVRGFIQAAEQHRNFRSRGSAFVCGARFGLLWELSKRERPAAECNTNGGHPDASPRSLRHNLSHHPLLAGRTPAESPERNLDFSVIVSRFAFGS